MGVVEVEVSDFHIPMLVPGKNKFYKLSLVS